MIKKEPIVIRGEQFKDARGVIRFNNDVNLKQIKRMYTIENSSLKFKRAWQGHQIEQRWFTPVKGRFKIEIVSIDEWPEPSRASIIKEFIIDAELMDVLHIPAGYLSSIQQLEQNSILMAYSDHTLGEIDDECKLDASYFNKL
jgi:dTDP-4-dehydrorhamnose 3,5-epimerase-like enzyme